MSALARCRHSTTMCALDNRERIQKDDPQARIVADGLECAGIPVHFEIDPLGVAKNPLEAGYLPVGQIDVVVGIRDKTGDHHYPNGVAHSARLEATRRCAACERDKVHGTYPPNCCNRYAVPLSPVAWLESGRTLSLLPEAMLCWCEKNWLWHESIPSANRSKDGR